MKRKIILILLTIILVIAGVYLDISSMNIGNRIDKIYHFTAFFVATLWLTFLLVSFFSRKHFNSLLIVSMLLGGAFAAFTEKIQGLTATRNCDPIDWFANMGGIMFAGAVGYLIFIKLNTKLNED